MSISELSDNNDNNNKKTKIWGTKESQRLFKHFDKGEIDLSLNKGTNIRKEVYDKFDWIRQIYPTAWKRQNFYSTFRRRRAEYLSEQAVKGYRQRDLKDLLSAAEEEQEEQEEKEAEVVEKHTGNFFFNFLLYN